MSEIFNVYCDESCHLEHDQHKVMALGAVWCPAAKTREIAGRFREVKDRHSVSRHFEVKANKVSPGRLEFYRDLIDYFLDDDDLHFRGVVIPDKSMLRHEAFDQDHDTWYYKMMFVLLGPILHPELRYRIYLDRKDTRGAEKVGRLHEVLANSKFDFDRRIVERVQVVESHHVEQLQLADLLTGLIGYANRGLTGNRAKLALLDRLRERTRYTLRDTTLLREEKVNLLVWRPASE